MTPSQSIRPEHVEACPEPVEGGPTNGLGGSQSPFRYPEGISDLFRDSLGDPPLVNLSVYEWAFWPIPPVSRDSRVLRLLNMVFSCFVRILKRRKQTVACWRPLFKVPKVPHSCPPPVVVAQWGSAEGKALCRGAWGCPPLKRFGRMGGKTALVSKVAQRSRPLRRTREWPRVPPAYFRRRGVGRNIREGTSEQVRS